MHPANHSVPRKPCAAFSLIELLITVAVAAVLASLVIKASSRAITAADRAQAVSNLRQLEVVARTYSKDNNARIIPNRYQNPSGPGGPAFIQNWRQMLVDSEYLSAPQNLARNAKALGHPALYKMHRKSAEFATFAMNQRLGYRAKPETHHGPGTYLQAHYSSRTLFMTGGVYRPGAVADADYPDVIWPTGTPEAGSFPEADSNGEVALLFLDGHVENRKITEIPRAETFNTEGRVFWRGTFDTIY